MQVFTISCSLHSHAMRYTSTSLGEVKAVFMRYTQTLNKDFERT
jgi:hypothetical protein